MQRDLAPLARGGPFPPARVPAACLPALPLPLQAAPDAPCRRQPLLCLRSHPPSPACLPPLSLPAAGEQHEQSALERELAAGRDVARPLTAADREQARAVEANVRHVLRQVKQGLERLWRLASSLAEAYSSTLHPPACFVSCLPARLQFPVPIPTSLLQPDAAAATAGRAPSQVKSEPDAAAAGAAPGAPSAAPPAAAAGAPQQLLSAAASHPA